MRVTERQMGVCEPPLRAERRARECRLLASQSNKQTLLRRFRCGFAE